MDAHIKFEGNITDEISYDLEQLAYLIEQDCDLSVGREKQPPKPGVKETGLTQAHYIWCAEKGRSSWLMKSESPYH
jgi:hypothetical protein